jgi:hypothetical protein
MAPVPEAWRNPGKAEKPPTNVAQMGMGWNLMTGTIDLGLELFDTILMIGDWVRNRNKAHAVKAKAADILRRGKRRPLQRRSINFATE